jgi:hypothetical protein
MWVQRYLKKMPGERIVSGHLKYFKDGVYHLFFDLNISAGVNIT